MMWGLTFHIFAIALLFGYFHVPQGVVQVIAAWKEAATLLILLLVLIRAAAGRGSRSAVGLTDLFAASWIGLAVVFFITENTLLRDFVPLKAALFGVRDSVFFVLFYFIGRSTPELARDYSLMKHAFAILVVTCLIAIAEQLLVTPEMLVGLGVAAYVQQFLGGEAFTQGNVYGLPDNYWSQMGGHFVRRSGSVFLSGQGFAMIFIVLMPLATLWLLDAERRTKWLAWTGYGVIWTGLLVTFTRTAILVCALQVLLVFALRRRVTGAALVAVTGLGCLVAAIAMFPSLATFVFETLTWQSGSSASHLKDWVRGLIAFLEQPWGYGLGTTDQTAVRAGLDPLTADNLYLKYAVELGLPGLVALVGTLATIGLAGARGSRLALSRAERDMGTAVLLIVIGVAIYGMTSTMFNDPIVGCVTFWLGGTAVSVSQRSPSLTRPAPVALGYV